MHSPKRRVMMRRAVARGLVAILFSGGAAPFFPAHSDSFPSRIDAAALDGSAGFRLRGVAPRDEACKSVAAAGDVNGDGIDDLVVGAPTALRSGTNWVGESYVLFGARTRSPALVDLATLGGARGFTMRGGYGEDFSGMSVAGVGDINVDGVDDLIIGAGIGSPNAIPEAGRSYVVFGSKTTFPELLQLRGLDASDGFLVTGLEPQDRMGAAVSRAGDFNHDGTADFLLGALGASPGDRSRAGSTYVLFGKAGLAAANLATLDGANGFTAAGVLEQDWSGASIDAAGDVNGDDIDDILIGAPRATRLGESGVGECYVLFGSEGTTPVQLDLFTLDGSNGFRVVGAGGQLGFSVSGAGDLNGDGIGDIVMGAPFATHEGRIAAGEALVLLGRDGGFGASVQRTWFDGDRGFRVVGPTSGAQLGLSVAGVGDVNGDGLDDLAVGAPFGSPQQRIGAGACYVIFGSRDGFPALIDPSRLDGENGFIIEGAAAGDRSGWSVAGAGDLDDDGVVDLVVGAPSASPDGAQRVGEGYVIYGRRSEVPVAVEDLRASVTAAGVRLSWLLRATSGSGALLQRGEAAPGPFANLAHFKRSGPAEYLDPDVEPGRTYWYRVVQADAVGSDRVTAALGVRVPHPATSTRLHAPRVEADGSVTIGFTLVGPGRIAVELRLLDVRGRVLHGFPRSSLEAGDHFLSWHRPQRLVGSGVYFVLLRAASRVDARKLVLLMD
ncbi:MAG: FG-GAP repeat protein [Candidatus Latescibacterota bacterium]|nr:MAG: FG-GAP repeat protein [Candidatus Latescibacterota bacterium]